MQYLKLISNLPQNIDKPTDFFVTKMLNDNK